MKNRATFGILFICLIILTNCAADKKDEYFTGEIDYIYSYESNTIDADSLAKTRPSKSNFRYDQYNYQSRFIGPDTITYYYSGMLNKCVSETGKQQNFECEDYGTITDSVLSYKFYSTDEKISGNSCSVLEIQKGGSWVKYYVSNELKIAPDTYKKHKSYNWDFYGEKAEGRLILKSDHRFKNFIMKGVMTSLKRQEGDFKALEIDENSMKDICPIKN